MRSRARPWDVMDVAAGCRAHGLEGGDAYIQKKSLTRYVRNPYDIPAYLSGVAVDLDLEPPAESPD